MISNEFQMSVLQNLGKELEANPEKLWHYASFVEEEKDFLGAVIIEAHGVIDASLATHRMKINPGGQMMCLPIPNDVLPPEKYRNRLLTKEEIQEFWPDAQSIREFEEDESVN